MKNNILLDLNHNLNQYVLNSKNLKLLKENINQLKKEFLNKKDYHVIIRNFEPNTKKIEKKIKIFSKLLGTPLGQNKHNDKFVKIKPNVKLIKQRKKNQLIKLRYHQTNAGGDIHSDGPQLATPPKYVIMGCIHQAKQGGYSLIVSTKKIAEYLKIKNPKILKLLKQKFFFERRGFNFSNNNIFKKPIFTISKNIFRFRYLREYIEAAYKIKSLIIDKKKIQAMDILDKLLIKKKFQSKYKLNEGDILILNNNYLAHGRSSFKLNDYGQRSLLRIWIR